MRLAASECVIEQMSLACVPIACTATSVTKCLHVFSHQDSSAEAHLLPWAAQTHVHANALATDCINNHADHSRIVPFKNCTIHSSISSQPHNQWRDHCLTTCKTTPTSDKQLASPERARDSWPGTPGLSMHFNPSIGTLM
jgi:hypothetical protein